MPDGLGAHPPAISGPTRRRLAIAANFTADPLIAPLQFWWPRLFADDTRIACTGYNQIFQDLIAPNSALASKEPGVNVLLVRVEDWAGASLAAHADASAGDAAAEGAAGYAGLRRTAEEFVAALTAFAGRAGRATFLVICPASGRVAADAALCATVAECADLIGRAATGLRGVQVITAAQIAEVYPVAADGIDDPEAEQQAHIPFTPTYWTAIATTLVRRMRAVLQPAAKVVVVDADNTLWGGVAAEAGAAQVDLTGGFQALQACLRRLKQQGLLLALVSKNREADVAAVFDRTDMLLRREDFVAWKINWDPKSRNIAALARELELGLDSFVFLDDNPLECAEVAAHCPAVTVLPMPADAREYAAFLSHVWPFDIVATTTVDAQRTELYRQQRERSVARTEAPSLREFIDGLELQVAITPLQASDYDRAAQLTQRTNQFNASGRRRTAAEFATVVDAGERHAWLIDVRDRFGDYGAVGLAIFAIDDTRRCLQVDTLLLSCRVLGKGVEHRLLAALGAEAVNHGATSVEIAFTHTERNQPVEHFLASTCEARPADAEAGAFSVSAAAAEAIAFDPDAVADAEESDGEVVVDSARPTPEFRADFATIARDLNSVAAIQDAMVRAARRARPALAQAYVAPRTQDESQLATIWAEVLHVDPVGAMDAFLDLGGRSLHAVWVAARIATDLGVRVPLVALLGNPTLAEIAKLVRGGADAAATSAAAAVLPKASDSSMSAAQRRLCFLDQFIANPAAYNIPVARRVLGPLRVDALELALGDVMTRHAMLRSSYGSDGVHIAPAPATASAAAARVAVQRASAASLDEAMSLAQENARREFLLSGDSYANANEGVLRCLVVSIADDDHVLAITVHHIASDGWSTGILLRDLARAYAARCADRPWAPAPPDASYIDYSAWQRALADAGELTADLDYWRTELQDAPVLLELPTDLRRPATMTYRGAVASTTLSSAAREAIETLAMRERCTPFAVLLAAWQTVLARYSRQDDIVVGTAVAGRLHTAVEDVIGCFVNTVAIRASVPGERSFRDQLKIVRTKVQQALAHQQLPFEHLVQALQPERDASRTPLFQVMLVLQDTPAADFAAPGLDVTSLPLHNGGAKFDLVLEVTPIASGGYDLALEFSTGLFAANTAEQLLRHFVHLLDSACATPDETLARLPLMNADELRQLLAPVVETAATSWARGIAPEPHAGASAAAPAERPEAISHASASCLHRWFERRVAIAPHAPALTCEGRTLTYDDLNRRANQVAHALIAAGVGPDALVGLCVDRSLELVIAILGILKAGGAYLPIDLSYPADRLAFMLDDAQAPVLLTHSTLVASLPPHAARTILVDDPNGTLATQPGHNPDTRVTPSHLAYVIYTSGSTGTPKGCMVTHQNVARLMRSTEAWYGFGDRDVWTLFHSCAFDFSVWELWGALLYGGRLVVVPFLVSRSPDAFLDLLAREQVTVLNQTPSAFRQLIDADARAADQHTDTETNANALALRYVIFGGEALDMQTLRPWFARHGDQQPRLVNMYGITETTVHVTYRPLSQHDLDSGSVIGIPIPDLQCYIVDRLGQPVPIGVPGEIYVGGEGLARGYLRRPELTNDRFIADYLSGRDGARLYKTGDLARRLASGDLEYLGRLDTQVKIRGFRIELGEIESVLGAHPAVREAVVVVREDTPGSRRLVAYLVASPPWPSSSDVRDHSRAKLPDYMVPAAFVFLDRLPLTQNGKIDRKALRAPEPERPDLAGRYVAARTPLEEALAGIWSKTLRIAQVGVHDNFFALGGDSILSIQVVSAARRAGLSLTPTQFFANQTIAELASLIDANVSPAAVADSQQDDARGELPLTPIQSWFFEQDLDDAHHYNQAFLFELQERLDRPRVEQALATLGRHHDALRLRFARTASGWQQRYADADVDVELDVGSRPLPLDWIDLASLDAADRTRRVEAVCAEAEASLDFERGPLARAVYFDAGVGAAAGSDRLLLVVHHLAVDGVSWRVLIEDFEAAYRGQPLPPKSSSYRAWAERLQTVAHNESLLAEQAYWRSRSSASTHVAAVPANTEGATRTVTVTLTTTETHDLLQCVPRAYNTQINDVLLTALARASARVTGSRVLATNLEGHGREPLGDDDGLDLSRTVGWFTSIFPVRLELPEDEDGEAAAVGDAGALKTIKEQLRQVPRRGVGYGLLRYIAGEASAVAQEHTVDAEPTLLFNYLGQVDQIVARSTLFRFAPESTGPWHAPTQRRRHLLEVNGLVIHDRLEVAWTYVPDLTPEAEVTRLAQEFIASLRGLIAHAAAPDAWGRTPSDFPLARIDQVSLDRLLAARRDVEDLYPLSPMQTLFLSTSAFDQWRCTLRGALDVDAFRQAWQDTIDRHSMLRTTFHTDGVATPLQLVHREVRPSWTIEDWRGDEETTRAQEWRWTTLLQEDAAHPLPLTDAPVMRFALVRLGDDEWRFAWSVPALLLDGWSWPRVFQDVSRAYAARASQSAPQFEPVRVYRDYIHWLAAQAPDASRAFWTRTLAGLHEPTTLPLERIEPAHARYASRKLSLSRGETEAVQRAAQGRHVTLNTLVQGAWAVMLARQSGQRDVTFGAAFSGRPTDLAGAEAIVGPFVNNLPVRVDVEPQASAGTLLQTLQARTLELSAFQFTSLLDIQRCSEVPWRYRLFDSLVVFQNYQIDDAARRLGGQIDIADFRGPVHTNFPVLLLVEPGETLDLTLIYDCHRLAAATLDRWCADLSILLTQLPTALDEPVATLLAQLSEPQQPARASASVTPTRTAGTAAGAAGIALARTPMQRSIADICQPLFALDQINVEENFFDLGATSLLLLQMHERLRSSLNTDFSVVTLFQHPTVRALATHLDERNAPSAPSGSPASPGMSAQRQRAEQQKQALARLKVRPKK